MMKFELFDKTKKEVKEDLQEERRARALAEGEQYLFVTCPLCSMICSRFEGTKCQLI